MNISFIIKKFRSYTVIYLELNLEAIHTFY